MTSDVERLRSHIIESTGLPPSYFPGEPIDHGEVMDALCRRDVFERHYRRYYSAFYFTFRFILIGDAQMSYGHPTAWTFPC